MTAFLKIASLISGGILLLLCAVFTYISLGFSKKRTAEAAGFLSVCDSQTNVYKGGRAGKRYRHWVEYAYRYTVDGREYRVGGANPGQPHEMRRTATVVYQIRHPGRAYIRDLTFPMQPFAAAALFVLGTILLICGIAL